MIKMKFSIKMKHGSHNYLVKASEVSSFFIWIFL